MKLHCLVVATVATLMGCASTAEPVYVFNPVKIEEQLKLSAKVVAESKQIRARSENAVRIAAMSEQEKERYRESVQYVPPGLSIALPMNEHREAETILDMISRYTNWDFDVRGKRPVNGAMVHIATVGAPAYDLILDIESQVQDRAKIILIEHPAGSPKHGMIVLDYFPSNI